MSKSKTNIKSEKSQAILSCKLVATVNVGVNPTAMAITSDSRKLYVANGNSYGISGSDTVTLIDMDTLMPVSTIFSETFNQPYTITLSKDETKAYVTNSNTSTISVIDTNTS